MTAKVLFLSELISKGVCEISPGAVLCFGHFNAIHPGHIRYFHTARQYGTTLVVVIEGDSQLPETERATAFAETERAEAVAALDMIDYVVILDTGSLEDFVRQVDIAALVLGKEFESTRASKVSSAVVEVRAQGAEVFYDAGETHYASAALFHSSASELEMERWRTFRAAQKVQRVSLSETLLEFSKCVTPRILVVGDTIVDRYVACDPVGMSNEAPVVVVKELENQDFVGGAGIVAAHVAALGGECTYVSVTGRDKPSEFVANTLGKFGVDVDLLEDDSRPTTFKIRYLVENQKLFRVSRLKEHSLPPRIENQVIQKIRNMGPQLDAILVSDFVYGVVTSRIVEEILDISRKYDVLVFGDLQCSSQVGNISKFQNFHLICPTEREARIALSNHDDGIEYVANLLMGKTKCANMILKLGAEGFIAYAGKDGGEFLQRQHFPALTVNPVDVAGAGDALLATMAVSLTQGLSLMQASTLACCVSAIAVQTVGNHPVGLNKVKQFAYEQDGITGSG